MHQIHSMLSISYGKGVGESGMVRWKIVDSCRKPFCKEEDTKRFTILFLPV